MPVHYLIDTSRQQIRTTCSGYVTFEEVAAHFQELHSDPEFVETFDVLLDMSGCTSLPTTEQLRDVVTLIASVGGRSRFGTCAVIASDDALYGLTRIFEVYARDVFARTDVFRAVEEGDRWLASLQEATKILR